MSNEQNPFDEMQHYGQPHGGVRRTSHVAAPVSAPPPPTPMPAVESVASPAALAAGQGEPQAITDETVTLSQAYEAHGDSVTRVMFREPTGKDISRIGVPMRFMQPEDGGDQIEFKLIAPIITRYIVELSDPPLPKSTVDKFRPGDWNACAQVINGFFQ